MNPNKTAKTAGLLYLIMAPFAMFGMTYIPSLIVPGDAATTASNILASASLFRLSIVSALLVQIGHLFLVLILYKLFKHVNKNHASLMVILLLVSIPITMLNELNRFAVLHLASGADPLTAFTAEQLHAQMMSFLDFHHHGILITSLFWGLWLFPMGYLVIKSEFLPKFLGIFLMIACFGYLIDSFGRLLSPDFGATTIATILGFAFWGELLFPLWLLIKGVNVEKWNKLAQESA